MRVLRKLDPPIARRIRAVIVLLAKDQRPPASRPLPGRPAWRVRVGDYRVIYTIEMTCPSFVVVALWYRRDVYER